MFEEAKKVIEESDVIVVMAGAGMSADSIGPDGESLPTFRGDEGFWKAYPKLGNKKMSFSQICTQQALNENPQMAWALYGHMFDLFNDTVPHTGFESLLKMLEEKDEYFVVTSNIDCHFQKAGFDEDRIYEIHGRMSKFQCTDCGELWEAEEGTRFDVDPDLLDFSNPPSCPDCDGLARPNIMMFYDQGFDNEETEAQAARFNTFMHKYDKGDHTIAIIEFGAGEGVPTIRMMGEYIQKNVIGATLIRVNPMDVDAPDGTVTVQVGALEAINNLI